jgi:hypothetical protein
MKGFGMALNGKDNNFKFNSAYIFKYKDRLYQVSFRIDEINPKSISR